MGVWYYAMCVPSDTMVQVGMTANKNSGLINFSFFFPLLSARNKTNIFHNMESETSWKILSYSYLLHEYFNVVPVVYKNAALLS